MTVRCPCRSAGEAKPYEKCCRPFHDGAAFPETAAQLMRSRYTAYALGKADYVLATWHASTRPASITLEPDQVWLGLKVVAHDPRGDTARVSFSARSRIGREVHVLKELSHFVRDDGRWYYVDGLAA